MGPSQRYIKEDKEDRWGLASDTSRKTRGTDRWGLARDTSRKTGRTGGA